MLTNTEKAALFDRQARTCYCRKKISAGSARRRSRLLTGIGGKVLEAGCGPGYNFRYYEPGAMITAVDLSPGMLHLAANAEKGEAVHIDLCAGNIEDMEFPHSQFDAIVSTLTFCSYENPVAVLGKFISWLKPGGTLAVLEHGISRSGILNCFLRVTDGFFHKRLGCHQERDMAGLFRSSGLTATDERTYFHGILYSGRFQK